jgi:cytochrome c peroxidase
MMRYLKLAVLGLFLAFVVFAFSDAFTRHSAAQGSLPAPTRLAASDGSYNSKVGLNWDHVRGATLYRIYRGPTADPTAAVEVATSPINYFFDTTAAAGQTFFYWVRGENGAAVGPLSNSDTGLRFSSTTPGPVPPLDPPNPPPPGNALTAAKSTLGKVLFWDEQLSSTGTVACGTCHRGGSGGSDPRTAQPGSINPGADGIFGNGDDAFGSRGVPMNNAAGGYVWSQAYGLRDQVTNRKSPTFVNSAYHPLLFWDGRAGAVFRDPITNNVILNGGGMLENQAAAPPVSDAEMGHTGRNWSEVATRLAASKPLALSASVPPSLVNWIDGRNYSQLFEEAFGSPDVTPARIIMAIATYERASFSDRAPIDLVNAGIETLTAQEQRGRGVFNQSNCNFCHVGQLFTDNQFHYIGVRPGNEDTGRFAVTADPNNLGEFRTPSLRNVGLRGPYMHNGRFATLEDVIDFYNRGGDFPNQPNFPSQFIRPLGLSAQQKADLAAFLRRPLTDPRVAAESQPFDRPGLFTESNRVPQITGPGRSGSGGFTPQPIAIEPPLAGNDSFTVALTGALGGSTAVLAVSEADPGVGTSIPSSGSLFYRNLATSGSGAGNGYASVSLSIPLDGSLVGRTFFGRWYINDPAAENGFSVTPAFRFTIFGEAPTLHHTQFDFDADGRADISIVRPSDNVWHVQRSSSNYTAIQYGVPGDVLAPADFDGDGVTDVAVFRPSENTWYVAGSRSGFYTVGWGTIGDVPVPQDYDGDQKADIAVYRPSNGTWYIIGSRDGIVTKNFGTAEDKPLLGDFDGDGRADLCVRRPSDDQWYILRTTAGYTVFAWGQAGDVAAPADYDSDGKTDIVVFRPATGTWYMYGTVTGFRTQMWGQTGDIPVAADFDGDSKADIAVFRPSNGTWYIINSSIGIQVTNFGVAGDIPVESVYAN